MPSLSNNLLKVRQIFTFDIVESEGGTFGWSERDQAVQEISVSSDDCTAKSCLGIVVILFSACDWSDVVHEETEVSEATNIFGCSSGVIIFALVRYEMLEKLSVIDFGVVSSVRLKERKEVFVLIVLL